MLASAAVKNLFSTRALAYVEVPAETHVSLDADRCLRAVLFKDQQGVILVVVPRDAFLDINSVRSVTARELVPLYAEEVLTFTAKHDETGAVVVPLGALYSVSTLMHEGIARDGVLYFGNFTQATVVGMNAQALHLAQREIEFGAIAVTVTEEWISQRQDLNLFTRKRIESLLEGVEGLPAMPEMAQRILHVTGDPDAAAQDLSKVIEVDPSLSAQIISYATSAFYGYRGDITSVREAISRVLGFELVANIALGIAIGTCFKVSAEGPIGLSAFWRHAVFTSALAERLCKALPRDRLARPAMAYLGGLLHDFGYLVLGHVVPTAFQSLNQAIAANPGIDVTILETCTLGITHNEIGPRLLQQWKLPDEAVIAAQWHHTPEYRDEFAVYPQLIAVAEHLLNVHGIGSDAVQRELPILMLRLLGVSEAAVQTAAQPVIDACASLDTLSQLLNDSAE